MCDYLDYFSLANVPTTNIIYFIRSLVWVVEIFRFKEELAHGGNAGLSNAVNWMEPIHAKYASQGLSYADLYTLAGVVAIRNMGGPAIPFNAGPHVTSFVC